MVRVPSLLVTVNQKSIAFHCGHQLMTGQPSKVFQAYPDGDKWITEIQSPDRIHAPQGSVTGHDLIVKPEQDRSGELAYNLEGNAPCYDEFAVKVSVGALQFPGR